MQVIATPDEEYVFTGWTGDIESKEEEITITMDQDKEIKANFEIGESVVDTCSKLQGMGDDLTADYILTEDLDCGDFGNFNSIGGTFTGSFDGQGHTISNLHIDGSGSWNEGLFGTLGSSGVVKDVGLIDVNVTGIGNVGGLAGRNEGVIHRSFVTGKVKANNMRAGGIVGINGDDGVRGNIFNSYSMAEVESDSIVGGLVANHRNGDIQNSYAAGDLMYDEDNPSRVGGLIGHKWGAAEVHSSYWNSRMHSESAGGEEKSTAEMTAYDAEPDPYPNAYSGWEFEVIWAVGGATDSEGESGYPALKWQND